MGRKNTTKEKKRRGRGDERENELYLGCLGGQNGGISRGAAALEAQKKMLQKETETIGRVEGKCSGRSGSALPESVSLDQKSVSPKLGHKLALLLPHYSYCVLSFSTGVRLTVYATYNDPDEQGKHIVLYVHARVLANKQHPRNRPLQRLNVLVTYTTILDLLPR